MAGSTAKEADSLEVDISSQDNVSRRPVALGRGTKQHIRHRASIACFSCRDRRIRCVVPKGGSGCIQCKRSGTECVIKMDDERRRPISKAYVSSLSARIGMLESMLQENGVVVPPAAHPPMTKHEAQCTGSGDEIRVAAIEASQRSKSDASSPIRHVLSPPYSHDDIAMYDHPMEDLTSTDVLHSREEGHHQQDHSPFRILDLKQEDVMHRLFFPNAGLSCDRLSGRLRFFGSTANCHVYADYPGEFDSRESAEKTRRAERVIGSLAPKTHDYLMQSFWKYHNSVLQVVDRAAFEADMGSENPKYYSSLLHMIILALGWRFANKDRYDIGRINLGNHESTLHREARYMLDIELERPTGIPSVQSLLLLGDLESGVCRDHTGWMYTGMANCMALDIGLHAECSNIGLPEREVSVRRRVVKACILYDRYWALFLGRPISFKSQDFSLGLSQAKHVSRISAYSQTIEEEIHEKLVELMDLAGQIAESRNETNPAQDTNLATLDVSTLHQQLRNWYGRLPSHLSWGPDNIRTAPYSYFLLHEQYHSVLILLHRSRQAPGFSSDGGSNPGTPSTPEDIIKPSEALRNNIFSNIDPDIELRELGFPTTSNNDNKPAHSICTQAAVQYAQILSHTKERYDVEKICCLGLQPAGSASIALLAAIAYSKDESDRRVYLSSLEIVMDAIRSMSRSYQPAARMGTLIRTVLAQLQSDTPDERIGHENSFGQNVNSCQGSTAPQCKDMNVFSFLPVGREQHDESDPSLQNNKPPLWAIPSQTASESNRPPPPFYHHIPPNPADAQNPLNHNNMNPMAGVFPIAATLPATAPLYPEPSLYGSAAMGGMNSIFASRHSSDNYLRVAPSAKGWGLHSLHAASQLEQHFNAHMPDWIAAAPANLSGNNTTALPEPGFGGTAANSTMPGFKQEDTGALIWVANEPAPANALAAVAPASPKNFMHNTAAAAAVEKTELGGHGRDAIVVAPPLNHELDYLAL
ncbi:fungal-specific transcription factor domain-containing protein [Nemania sp. FL0916]|nr:fungal-specific transcription factor domain-containing protein [Nemania sp. FL0916]